MTAAAASSDSQQQQRPPALILPLPGHPSSQNNNDNAVGIVSVAAPMVAASDYAFRCLCRQYGVDLTYTQMLHSRNLVRDEQFRSNHLDLFEFFDDGSNDGRVGGGDHGSRAAFGNLHQSQRNFLDGAEAPSSKSIPHRLECAQSGPVMVQLAGNDVDLVVSAAQLVLDRTNGKVTGIDLNLGCPQGIARKGNYGAFLVEQDEATACRILTALRESLPKNVAVSCKVRLPTDEADLSRRITRLLDTGIDFMTVHGRTLRENKTKVGPCRVDRIAEVVRLAQQRRPGFPVVANGGIETSTDAMRLLQTTGAAAVMSSEALLERPDLFQQRPSSSSSSCTPREALHRQFQFARDYVDWCRLYPPLPGVLGHVGGSFNVARGHMFKFLHRYLQEHHDLREELSSRELTRLVQAEEFLDVLYGRYDELTDDELAGLQSSQPSSSWYRRHWGASRRVHVRNRQSAESPADLSVDERKELLKSRIANLKQERLQKQQASL